MANRLSGKIALISGASSGLGAAQAKLFASEGAKVVIGDVQTDLGNSVVADIKGSGGEALFVGLDVTNESSWKAAVVSAKTTFGGLTTLVNNAGIFHPGGIEGETIEGWSKTIAVNQTGVYLGMKTAATVRAVDKG